MHRTVNMLNVMGAVGEHSTVFTNAGTDRNHHVPPCKYCYGTSASRLCSPCAFSSVTHM